VFDSFYLPFVIVSNTTGVVHLKILPSFCTRYALNGVGTHAPTLYEFLLLQGDRTFPDIALDVFSKKKFSGCGLRDSNPVQCNEAQQTSSTMGTGSLSRG